MLRFGTDVVEPSGSAVRVLMMEECLLRLCILLESIGDGDYDGLVVVHCLVLLQSFHSCVDSIFHRSAHKIEAYRANRFAHFQQAEILNPSV
jgi:hypothetical protein